MNYRR